MKNKKLFFFALLLLCISACKDDDDCLECEVCEECEIIVGYENHTVDFFSSHKDFVIIPREFETVTEQILIRPAHQEGAIFETVTEQYLSKSSSTRFQIMDSTMIYIVANSEKDSIAAVTCYRFYDEADIAGIQIPAEYMTVTKQSLLQAGTGANVPAIYTTLVKQILVSDAEVLANPEPQTFERIRFRTPDDQNFRAYLENQFLLHDVEGCVEGNAYVIIE